MRPVCLTCTRCWRTAPAILILFVTVTQGAQAQAEVVEIVRQGQQVPGLPCAATITNFDSPPTLTDAGYVALRLHVDGPCIDPNTTAGTIYRWDPTGGLRFVVQQGSPLPAFAGLSYRPQGTQVLAFLETPIADDAGKVAFTALLDTGDRALLIWTPGENEGADVLDVALVVGDIVPNMVGHTIGGGTFNFDGEIVTMATFDQRAAAAFRFGRVFFRAAVDPVSLPGLPDAIWLYESDSLSLTNISNGFQRLELSNPMNLAFWEGYPNLGFVETGSGLSGVALVSQAPTRSITQFSDQNPNSHLILTRYHPPPGGFPELDYRTNGFDHSVAAGMDPTQEDNPGDEDFIGVWLNLSQVYSNTVTPAEGVIGSTLATPVSQTITVNPAKSVFAAQMTGGDGDGKRGVWIGTQPGDHQLIGWEGLIVDQFPNTVILQEIFTVHVGSGGPIVLHARLHTPALGTNREVLYRWDPVAGLVEVLSQGDSLTVGGQPVVISGFLALGFGGAPTGPVISGTGLDGHLSAMNGGSEFAFLVLYEPASGPRGEGAVEVGAFSIDLVDELIFADDFESGDSSAWTDTVP